MLFGKPPVSESLLFLREKEREGQAAQAVPETIFVAVRPSWPRCTPGAGTMLVFVDYLVKDAPNLLGGGIVTKGEYDVLCLATQALQCFVTDYHSFPACPFGDNADLFCDLPSEQLGLVLIHLATRSSR